LSFCLRASARTGKYVKVVTTEDGGSRFIDIDIEQTEAPFAENVPPLLVSQPLPVQRLVFVTAPDDLREAEPHPAPRRQFVVVLDGEFEIETTDGDRRIFPPGGVALVEDTARRGHVTRASRGRASFLAVPLADT
jgi:hypothetical protein